MTTNTQKKILLTGATDGIGLATAKILVTQGHHLLLHGRSSKKLEAVLADLSSLTEDGMIESYICDMSKLDDVKAFAESIIAKHQNLDVLINNAGVFKTNQTTTEDGMDVRFVVNTIAPYLLTQALLPLLGSDGRVVNLSSAAQAPVDLSALKGEKVIGDMEAYSQSKLAITMWSRSMAIKLKNSGPLVVSVNPGSLLASKMVKEGFGVAGHDLNIGADILVRAALSDEFSDASGMYFDNDSKQFASPHPDALDPQKAEELESVMEKILAS